MKKSGIDIDMGHLCSKIAYTWAQKTFSNREGEYGEVLLEQPTFSNAINFGQFRIGMATDGIGTKVEVAERLNLYITLGYDLMAMVADDLSANGFIPANVTNVLDVDYLDDAIINRLMCGFHHAANRINVSIIGGEIAELGNRVSGWGSNMHFNWSATIIGFLPNRLDEPITGKNIKSGDLIIGLESAGFRCNGFSLARETLTKLYGPNWHEKQYDSDLTWGQVLLTPSRLYSRIVNKLWRGHISGMAHITGGGLYDNLNRVIKMPYKLNNLIQPKEEMLKLQRDGKLTDKQCYKAWNMGCGYVLIVSPENSEMILQTVTEDCPAIIMGKVL